MDLQDRCKLIFVGFGRVRWIRVEMATYLDGSGKIWMTLIGFDRIWADLVGFGWIWGAGTCGFLSWILLVITRFYWIIKGFGLI